MQYRQKNANRISRDFLYKRRLILFVTIFVINNSKYLCQTTVLERTLTIEKRTPIPHRAVYAIYLGTHARKCKRQNV